jgi:hypothetical protein
MESSLCLVHRPKETASELLQRFDAALGKVLADGHLSMKCFPKSNDHKTIGSRFIARLCAT